MRAGASSSFPFEINCKSQTWTSPKLFSMNSRLGRQRPTVPYSLFFFWKPACISAPNIAYLNPLLEPLAGGPSCSPPFSA